MIDFLRNFLSSKTGGWIYISSGVGENYGNMENKSRNFGLWVKNFDLFQKNNLTDVSQTPIVNILMALQWANPEVECVLSAGDQRSINQSMLNDSGTLSPLCTVTVDLQLTLNAGQQRPRGIFLWAQRAKIPYASNISPRGILSDQ